MVFLLAGAIQLVPDGTLVLHIFLILLMIAVLNATLFKPINRILDERDRRTKGSGRETQGILRKIDEGLARYESSLRKARMDGYSMLEQERSVAMGERQKKIGVVKDDLGKFLEEQKNLIAQQGTDARRGLEVDVQRYAAEITRQILGRAA